MNLHESVEAMERTLSIKQVFPTLASPNTTMLYMITDELVLE